MQLEIGLEVTAIDRRVLLAKYGKNLDLGEALRGYVQDRVVQTVERYIGRTPSGHVRIEKEHGEFRTNCTIHLWQGMSLEAHGVAVGSRLQDFTTGSWSLFGNPARRLIGLNVQPFDAAKHDALAVVGDAAATLSALDGLLGAPP